MNKKIAAITIATATALAVTLGLTAPATRIRIAEHRIINIQKKYDNLEQKQNQLHADAEELRQQILTLTK